METKSAYGEVYLMVFDVQEEREDMGDDAPKVLEVRCPLCEGSTLITEKDACCPNSDCDIAVVWLNSREWSTRYGRPKKAIEDAERAPHSPIEKEALTALKCQRWEIGLKEIRAMRERAWTCTPARVKDVAQAALRRTKGNKKGAQAFLVAVLAPVTVEVAPAGSVSRLGGGDF